MSGNELEAVSQMMVACNARHQENMRTEWQRHLKSVQKAINIRVGVPVGVLCSLLILVLGTVYNNGVKSAENQVRINQALSSTQVVKNDIEKLDKKLDANFKWLIENARLTNSAIHGNN